MQQLAKIVENRKRQKNYCKIIMRYIHMIPVN